MNIQALTLCLATLSATAAQAHVALETPQAHAGAAYKAVLRISHGCGGTATHTVAVRLPAGFRGAKPMPKPGWTISLTKAPPIQPGDNPGRPGAQEVVEIVWQANGRDAWLPDAHYDEFVLRGQAPAAAGPAWFKVQQLCEQGRWDWSEVPATGTSTQGLKAPAVLLEVVPAAAGGHAH